MCPGLVSLVSCDIFVSINSIIFYHCFNKDEWQAAVAAERKKTEEEIEKLKSNLEDKEGILT